LNWTYGGKGGVQQHFDDDVGLVKAKRRGEKKKNEFD